ncbi:MAG TPA: shikimate kinase, partial [Acidimicrobiia bacterium]
MASGKTTVGRLLGVRLGRPFVDNDVVLERRTGHTAREIAL